MLARWECQQYYQIGPDNKERLVACVSRTLQPAEKNYPIIHLESLSIYWGLLKFYQYLYGKKIKIRTDHKPLIALLHPEKGIPQMHANRMQRWATFLTSFNYEIESIKGQNNVVADYLSRAPLKVNYISDEYDGLGNYVNFIDSQEGLPIQIEDIRTETKKDKILQEVIRNIERDKWSEVTEELHPYHNRRNELIVDKGVIVWGHRIVIPKTLQRAMVEEVHQHHFGMEKSKSIARAYIYWPQIDKYIEEECRRCIHCIQNKSAPPKTQLTPWEIESEPWNRINMEFLGPIKGKMILVILDAYSKWPEAYVMKTMTSEETEEKLKDACARFGVPKTIVTDGGRQFTAESIQTFFKRNGIQHHITSRTSAIERSGGEYGENA